MTIDLGLASAVQSAQKQLEEAMRPLGGVAEAFAKFGQQHRDAQKAMLATLAGPFGDIARTGQWASALGAVETSNVTRLFSEKVSAAVGDIQASMLGSFSQAAAFDQAKMSAMLGLSGRFVDDLASTQLKMSAIAGISETFSLRTDLRIDVYQSLFGEWRTRPDLPDNYWRDARVRRRMYRDAEVDDGLIVATPGIALEVMIESGLTTGMRSEANAVAVVTLGEVFINRAEFDHDMQKLIAARRPTMHVRTMDGVRLVELVCVVQRLSEQMADDGAWKRLAELDH